MTALTETHRELAHRRTDGLEVRLLWQPETDRVTVSLVDARTGEGFEVPVRPGERALDVFHHPFPYAEVRHAAKQRVRAA